jgi:glycosyltransferase involved in cell wall biosynthesis
MKIVFFTKGDRRLPSSRTRAFLFSDYLQKRGFDSSVYHVQTRAWWNVSVARVKEFVRNARVLFSVGKEDVVFLQRTVHQVDFLILVFLRKFLLRRGYVFDFDDAIFLEKGHADLKTRTVVKYANVVFAGSRFLEEYAKRFNKNVYVMTTVINTEDIFVPRPKSEKSKEIVIGWTGTPVHYDNMKLLVEPLKRLIADGLSIQLKLVGGGDKIPELFKTIKGLNLVVHSFPPTSTVWSDPREIVKHIQTFDIGVYPLQKTEWNKGKDTYKAKEFMACAVPVIVSVWGENPYIIKEDINGLLADTEEEWYEKLKHLITDEKYRKELGQKGRTYIENECSFKAFVPMMLERIKEHQS